VWNLYADECLRPDSVTFYDALEQVPLSRVDRRNRAFLKAIAANVAISSHRWRFDTTELERLKQHGCEFPRATLQSLSVCQRVFVAGSSALARFSQNHLACRPLRA
jgi:hypothetical protein